MNTPLSQDLIVVFSNTAHSKLGHLDSLLAYAMQEGFLSPVLAGLQRTLDALRGIGKTFNQEWLSETLEKNFLRPLHKIITENRTPSQTELATLEDAIFTCRNQIQELLASTLTSFPQQSMILEPSDNTKCTMLSAIGQISIWNFHEINGQLAKLHGYNEMIEDWVRDLNKRTFSAEIQNEVSELRQIIIKSQRALTNISEGIRRTRTARGRIKANRQPITAQDFVKQLVENESSRNIGKWEIGVIPEVLFMLDKPQFEFLWISVTRLLVDWMAPETNLKIRCECIPSENQQSVKLVLVVEPVSDKTYPIELSKFHITSTTPYKDTGSVFAVARRLAKSWEMELQTGLSSTGFPAACFTIPCTGTGASAQETVKEASQESKPQIAQASVLVVDDDKDIGILLQRKLKRLGYPTIVVSNVAAAKEALKNEKIGVALIDLFLEKESGVDLLSSIKKNNADVKVILISGAEEDNLASRFLQAIISHADAFLHKPIDDDLFKATLEKFYPH